MPNTLKDLWANVNKKGYRHPVLGYCWEWTGPTDKQGYGRFYCKQLSGVDYAIRVHRLLWTIIHGSLAPGIEVCHKCDNPPCLRPSHLFAGTHTDNMRDAARKGRLHSVPGELRPNSKLTREDAASIRKIYAEGTCGARTLAIKFGVSRATIKRVLAGTHWKE